MGGRGRARALPNRAGLGYGEGIDTGLAPMRASRPVARGRAIRAPGRACAVAGGLALVLALVLALAAPSLAEEAREVREALASLGGALGLQDSFPGPKPLAAQPRLEAPGILRVLLWIAVACGAAALAWYLMDILPKGIARRTRWGAAAEGASAAPGSNAAAQENADDLARQGRFVEAMHLLLLQSLAEMRKRLDQRFADSLTSREILRRAPVSGPARSALGDLIEVVERAYFGDHPAGPAEYQLCRARFAALDAALRGGLPPSGAPATDAPAAGGAAMGARA